MEDGLKVSKDEILEWASRYVSVEKSDFPIEKDLFCFMSRAVPDNKVLKEDEGWRFSGYGYCLGYVLDEEEKPMGKWIYMDYMDLAQYPLEKQSLKLQPPHITNGRFFSPNRAMEIKMERLIPQEPLPLDGIESTADSKWKNNLLSFNPSAKNK